MYKGEDLLHIGTLDELAEAHGVKRETIKFYLTPAYLRRIARRKKPMNYITLTKLEDEEEWRYIAHIVIKNLMKLKNI